MSNHAFDPDFGSAVADTIRAGKIPYLEDATPITFAQLLTREIGGFQQPQATEEFYKGSQEKILLRWPDFFLPSSPPH
jgi:hypothetical protein